MQRFWKGFSLFAMMYAVTLSVLVIETGHLALAAKVAVITAGLKSVVAVFHHTIWKRPLGAARNNGALTDSAVGSRISLSARVSTCLWRIPVLSHRYER